MAEICGKIYNGQDNSCRVLKIKYAQEVVLVNHSDIIEKNISVECAEGTSKYSASPVLREGAKGVRFTGPIAGNIIRLIHNKTTSDKGLTEYEHGIDILFGGASEEDKCALAALNNGLVVAFARLLTYKETTTDGSIPAIEIAGLNYGLRTGDYTYDLMEEGGLVPIELRSLEGSFENDLPYIYKSQVPGSEILDFEALFENVVE